MKISRKTAWLVTAVMLVNLFAVMPGVANGIYQEGEFTKIYSFSDYDVAFTTAVAAFPEGMIAQQTGWRTAHHGYVDYIEEDRASRVLKIANTAEPIIPFGTNFLDGFMHVSFDYRHTGENNMLSFMLARNTSTDTPTESSVDVDGVQYAAGTSFVQDEYDYNRFINGSYTRIFGTGNASNTSNPINRSIWHNASGRGLSTTVRQGAGNSVGQSLQNNWYKVDIYLDREDTGNYYVYIDGVLANYEYDVNGNIVGADDKQSSVNYADAGNNAIKGIAVRHENLKDYSDSNVATLTSDDYAYLDNIYVNHYTADDVKNDTIKLVLDTLNKSVLEAGDRFSIAYTEALSSVPAKDDIVIKDASGEEFTDFTVNADKAQSTITLGETIGTGKYTVTINNVKGAISNSTISDEVTFTASSKPASAADTSFNYIDEDFEGLESGVVLPNWYFGAPDFSAGLTNTRYYTTANASGYASRVEPVERNGKTAIKLLGSAGDVDTELYYYFPSGIANGSFKAEFDIMHQNGGWTFGFVNYSNYQAAAYKFTNGFWNGFELSCTPTWNQWQQATTADTTAPVASGKTANDAQTASVIAGRARQSVFLGMGNNSTDELADATDGVSVRALSPNLGIVGGKNKEADSTGAVATRSNTNNVEKIDGLTVAQDKWTKVEVSINDNNKKYTITTTPYNDDGTLNEDGAVTKEYTDFATNRFLGGIMGIRISRNGAGATESIGDVCFDNLKVYKEKTTYLDDDFNNYTTTTQYVNTRQQGPSGWQQWSDKTHTDTTNTVYESNKGLVGVTSVARNATDTIASENDRAMELFSKNPTVFKTLDTPVPAGKPFAIEFDVYNVGADAQHNAWSFMQMGKEDTVILPTYNYPNTVTKSGKFSIAKDMFINHFYNSGRVNDTQVKTYLQWYDGVSGAYDDTKGNTTYSYISGDLMKNNVVFGRIFNPNVNEIHLHKYLCYSATGRANPNEFVWNSPALSFTNTSDNTTTKEIERIGTDAAWTRYKVVCIPESATKTTYKVTATYLDTGATYTSTFSNTRDWFTKDTYAIGFAQMQYASYFDNLTDSGSNYFDNVKVYAVDADNNELTSINLQSVEKVEAINTVGDTFDVTEDGVLPLGTNKLAVTFTSPVNELLSENASLYKDTFGDGFTLAKPSDTENEDYTNIITTIKDFVQLRKSGSQTDCYTSLTLSNDNKTVILTLASQVEEGSKYTLGVNENISFTSSAYDKLASNFVKTWDVEKEAELDLTLDVVRKTGTSYIPLHKSGVSSISKTDDVKIKIAGYSPVDELPILVAYSYYTDDETSSRMIDCGGIKQTIGFGKIEDELSIDIEKIPDEYTKFKAFLWNYDTLKPYIDAYEY